MNLKSKKVAVLGFGLEGRDLVNYLLKQGAYVTILDQKRSFELDFKDINVRKVNLICGEDYLDALFVFDVISYNVTLIAIYKFMSNSGAKDNKKSIKSF